MNILLINADQLRHDSLGYRGLRPVKTPNIDALAAESLVYENAFTPLPVCSPARQALLSGRRPDYFGAQWNYDFMPTPELDPAICWPQALSSTDRRLGYVGRFHVSAMHKPAAFGFHDFVDMHSYNAEIKERFPDAQYSGGWLGCKSPIPLEYSRTHWQAKRASELLGLYTASDKPWLLWVDFEEPHLPCRPRNPFRTCTSLRI
ncbi:MAG: sulfatase-like hydrolase/transferase [Clostridia bacterium]|nr:sulfatase-like hydrolase/transferase [Clostridia bacterium]